MRICVVGTGYVGLVTGACLADFGMNVTCVDKDTSKIDMLLDGKMPIYEPGLDDLVERNAAAGRLKFTTSYDPAVGEADEQPVSLVRTGDPGRPARAPAAERQSTGLRLDRARLRG